MTAVTPIVMEAMPLSTNGPSRYFVNLQAFPINIDIAYRAVPTAGVWVDVENDTAGIEGGGRLKVKLKQLESFVYNERYALEATLERAEPQGGDDCTVFLFLPIGCLAVLHIHRIAASRTQMDLADLRDVGHRYYLSDVSKLPLIYAVIEQLAADKLITHCPVLPHDIFDLNNPWSKTIGPELFETEMTWRAWSSGNYVSISADQGADQTWDWPCEAEYVDFPHLDSPNGRFRILFNNYFGWQLSASPSANADDEIALITTELEPVAYMISRRSQCASGLRNVKDLCRAFVWDRSESLHLSDMRRYVSAARLALLAPKEYEESSDKRSRAIYVCACRDLDIEEHSLEFNQGIHALTEEVRGVQAERNEDDAKRLNRFALILTAVFGLSMVADISAFIGIDIESLTVLERVSILTAVAGGMALWVWRMLRSPLGNR